MLSAEIFSLGMLLERLLSIVIDMFEKAIIDIQEIDRTRYL